MDFAARLAAAAEATNRVLDETLQPTSSIPGRLQDATRYATLAAELLAVLPAGLGESLADARTRSALEPADPEAVAAVDEALREYGECLDAARALAPRLEHELNDLPTKHEFPILKK